MRVYVEEGTMKAAKDPHLYLRWNKTEKSYLPFCTPDIEEGKECSLSIHPVPLVQIMGVTFCRQ